MREPTDKELSRDLEADLAVVNAATPPPWTWEDDPPTVYSGRDYGHGLNLFGRLSRDKDTVVNLDFVTKAREGWEAAIVLANHYRKECERLKARLEFVEAAQRSFVENLELLRRLAENNQETTTV